MINTLIYGLAWSQAVVPILLTTIPFFLRGPFFTMAAGVLIEVYFVAMMLSAGWIARLAGCDRFDEGSTSGCVLWGVDVSSSLYTLGMTGWLGMFVLPLGFFVLAVGIVQGFGWLGLLKGIGLLFVAAMLFGFFWGLLGLG